MNILKIIIFIDQKLLENSVFFNHYLFLYICILFYLYIYLEKSLFILFAANGYIFMRKGFYYYPKQTRTHIVCIVMYLLSIAISHNFACCTIFVVLNWIATIKPLKCLNRQSGCCSNWNSMQQHVALCATKTATIVNTINTTSVCTLADLRFFFVFNSHFFWCCCCSCNHCFVKFNVLCVCVCVRGCMICFFCYWY